VKDSSRHLARRYNLRICGYNVIFYKTEFETDEHIIQKALVYALYAPTYGQLLVDVDANDKYRPDLVKFDDCRMPVFWAECGKISVNKVIKLAKKYRDTHLVFAKPERELERFANEVREELSDIRRDKPIDMLGLPVDGAERFFDSDGNVIFTFEKCVKETIETVWHKRKKY